MNIDTLICIWILAFPICIIQVSTSRKWSFLLYFSSLHDYWLPTTLISLAHISLGEMEWCEKRAFQLLKMQKKKFSWNIKTKCVTDFFWQLGLRVWRIILVITWLSYKINVYIKFNKINVIFEFFFLHVTGYLNTKESFPICMFVVIASGKCELHTYYTFLQRILISTHIKIFNIFFA